MLEGGEQGRLVGGARGGHEDGGHARCGQRLGGVAVGHTPLDAGGDRLGPVGVEVDDGGHMGAADHVGDPAHVVGAHPAGADDGDTE